MTLTSNLRGFSTTPDLASRKAAGPESMAQGIPLAFAVEQYRVLAHIVEQLAKVGKAVIAISSPVSGDGKTLTSVNLARTLAQAPEARVLLIDADLRRGSVGERFGFRRAASLGLAGAVADPACRLEAVVRHSPGSNLWILPRGACPATPYEALRSARLGELLVEARARYDYIIVDTPPVVPVADWRALSEWVDGFFLVVSAHVTPRALLDEALSAMDPEKVIGLVFNGDDQPFSRRYRYYYSYGKSAPQPGFWAALFGRGPATEPSPMNGKSRRMTR